MSARIFRLRINTAADAMSHVARDRAVMTESASARRGFMTAMATQPMAASPRRCVPARPAASGNAGPGRKTMSSPRNRLSFMESASPEPRNAMRAVRAGGRVLVARFHRPSHVMMPVIISAVIRIATASMTRPRNAVPNAISKPMRHLISVASTGLFFFRTTTGTVRETSFMIFPLSSAIRPRTRMPSSIFLTNLLLKTHREIPI